MASEHESWLAVAADLGVRVISPFELIVHGTRVAFTALLPQFGGSAGMIIDPDWSVIKPHADALTKAGYGYSCISIDGSAPDEMRDVLLDWGWNGTTAQKPDWL